MTVVKQKKEDRHPTSDGLGVSAMSVTPIGVRVLVVDDKRASADDGLRLVQDKNRM